MEISCKETVWLPYIYGIYALFAYLYIFVYPHVFLDCIYSFLCIDYLFFFQIVSISEGHTCASTSQVKGKEATKVWIADRAKEVLKSNPAMGDKKLKDQLEQQFPIKLSYNKVWEGRQLALEGLHGTWEDSTLVAEAPAISTSLVSQSPVSPGPITRRMAASTSTLTRPPDTHLSPGLTTRSMAA